MTGQINISGSTASVQLKGNDRITTDQTFTFPDAGGELVVTPGTADIKTSGAITAGQGNLTANINGDFVLKVKNENTVNPNGLMIDMRDVGSDNDSLALRVKGHNNETGLDITSDGAISSKGQITANVSNSGGENSAIKAIQSNSNGYAIWVGNGPNAADRTASIIPDGRATFNSTVDAGRLQVTRQSGTYQVLQVRNGGPSATKTAWIQADGNASFVSTRSANVFINLDPDNPQNYVSTANKETGETEQVYSGPTLDVRQVLLDLQSKVEALQAEIQTLKGGAS